MPTLGDAPSPKKRGRPRAKPDLPKSLPLSDRSEPAFEQAHVDLVLKLAQLGTTEDRIANVIGISQNTFRQWCEEHSDFMQALKEGRDYSDANVANFLYRRATGYEHKAVKIFCDPKTGAREIVDYVEHYPPDTTACIFWLKNRRPDLWRDRIEHTGKDGGAIKTEQTLKVDALAPDDRDVLRSLLQAAMPEDERELAARREKMQ